MRARRTLKYVQWTCLAAGITLLAWPAYVAAESAMVQRAGAKQFSAKPRSSSPQTGKSLEPMTPARGSMLAQFTMPRLGLTYVLLEGADSRTLDKSIGHVEHTAYPGQPGNIGIAGHRNTHFRKLEWVRTGDEILLRSKDNEYRYLVKSARLVSPNDVSVLDPSEGPALTIVTCFPFEYVGSAPMRFIVKAVPDEGTLAKLGLKPDGNELAASGTGNVVKSMTLQ